MIKSIENPPPGKDAIKFTFNSTRDAKYRLDALRRIMKTQELNVKRAFRRANVVYVERRRF